MPEPGKDGNTFYSEQKMEDGSVETWYFAVYNFIEGRATYDWINNMMPQYTYESVAELLAELHNADAISTPETYEKSRIRCDGLMKRIPPMFSEVTAKLTQITVMITAIRNFRFQIGLYRRDV